MPKTKKRIKIAVVGSASVSAPAATKLARAILTNLREKYVLSQIITIQEDPLGRAIRLEHKASGGHMVKGAAVIKTYSEKKHATQSDADILVAADILWATTNYILVHNGDYSWAQHLGAILTRYGRRYKLLEIKR